MDSAIGDTGYSLLVRIAAKMARSIIFLPHDPNSRENGNGSALVVSYRRETVEIVIDSNASVKTYCRSRGIQ